MHGKFSLLQAAIDTDAFDVILLQKTLLPEGQSVSFKGYRAFYLPAVAGAARGCGILVKDVYFPVPECLVPRYVVTVWRFWQLR